MILLKTLYHQIVHLVSSVMDMEIVFQILQHTQQNLHYLHVLKDIFLMLTEDVLIFLLKLFNIQYVQVDTKVMEMEIVL